MQFPMLGICHTAAAAAATGPKSGRCWTGKAEGCASSITLQWAPCSGRVRVMHSLFIQTSAVLHKPWHTCFSCCDNPKFGWKCLLSVTACRAQPCHDTMQTITTLYTALGQRMSIIQGSCSICTWWIVKLAAFTRVICNCNCRVVTMTFILVWSAGLRARSANASERRRLQMPDNFRSPVEQIKSPPPRYNAEPMAASAGDDVTNATATATPFAMSISQVQI